MKDKEFRDRWKAYKEGKELEPIKEKEFKVEECAEPKVAKYIEKHSPKRKPKKPNYRLELIADTGYTKEELHKGGIYGLIDDVNNVCYIGECKDFYNRWSTHEKLNKFNKDTVKLVILKVLPNRNKKQRCYYETMYINTYILKGYKIMNKIKDPYAHYLITKEGHSFHLFASPDTEI